VTAYNSAVAFLQEKTGYNETTKAAGVLMGDSMIAQINNDLRLPLVQQTSGFVVDVDSFLLPGQIGLDLDGDGLLALSTSTFDEAIAEDYMGVLAVIGADKTGSSDSNVIEFYGASSNFTTAGTYDVQVSIVGGAITSARIKLEEDTAWRNAMFNGNIVTGDGTFDERGEPVYPENGLQLSADLDQDGTFTAKIRIREGFAGALEDTLDRILKATTGTLPLDQEQADDQIEHLQDRIAIEEDRLKQREARLVAKFARLEKAMALLQNQMKALGM
jgi:flagellar hook-associated protein 2